MPGWKLLIVCDGVETKCTYDSLIELVKVLINDMVIISTLLAVLTFIWVGIKLLSSGGNESAMTDAKKMLWKVVIGYLWILAAWLVVYTITSVLLKDGYSLLGAPK